MKRWIDYYLRNSVILNSLEFSLIKSLLLTRFWNTLSFTVLRLRRLSFQFFAFSLSNEMKNSFHFIPTFPALTHNQLPFCRYALHIHYVCSHWFMYIWQPGTKSGTVNCHGPLFFGPPSFHFFLGLPARARLEWDADVKAGEQVFQQKPNTTTNTYLVQILNCTNKHTHIHTHLSVY